MKGRITKPIMLNYIEKTKFLEYVQKTEIIKNISAADSFYDNIGFSFYELRNWIENTKNMDDFINDLI